MSSFPQALSAVIGHLERSRESGRVLGASRSALERLHDTPTATLLSLPISRPTARTTATPAASGSGTKAERLARLQAIAATCTKCPQLAASRMSVVFGVGNPDSEIMFVGEAPGADEDVQGEPFVGRAGQLLTKIIQTMGYRREEVYIANILKCRPDTPGQAAGNRPPTPEEMTTCFPYLIDQIEIIQPRVIVGLGATAAKGLLGQTRPLGELRGTWHDFRGTPLMVTYHPAYLLRNQALSEKRKAWEDMLQVKERLGHAISDRDRGYFLAKSSA